MPPKKRGRPATGSGRPAKKAKTVRVPKTPTTRCSGWTKKGKRCTHRRKNNGTQYWCHQHRVDHTTLPQARAILSPRERDRSNAPADNFIKEPDPEKPEESGETYLPENPSVLDGDPDDQPPELGESEDTVSSDLSELSASFSDPNFLADQDPCDFYHQRRHALSQSEDVAKWRVGLEKSPLFTTEEHKYLNIQEVLLSITSVTASITNDQEHQGHSGGFSVLSDDQLQFFGVPDPGVDLPPAARFGRPILVPYFNHNHLVLMVIRLNREGQPDIAFIDSRAWHFSRAQREGAYQAALNLIRNSQWSRTIAAESPAEAATWVPCAQQRENWTCGYYTVLNAWALALGLELNFVFQPQSHDFFEEAQWLFALARGGFADWRLIHSFLACKKYVKENQQVRPDLRFAPSGIQLLTEDDLSNYTDALLDAEEKHWRNNAFIGISRSCEITVPQEFLHHEHRPSDDWSEDLRANKVLDLMEWKRLDVQADPEDIKDDWKNALRNSAETIDQYWKRLFGGYNQRNGINATRNDPQVDFEKFLDDCSDPEKLDKSEPLPNHVQALQLAQVFKNPCAYFEDMMKRFESIDRYFTGSRTTTWQPHPERIKLPKKANLYVEDETISLAIASVLEPINYMQSKTSENKGGFSIAESSWISMGRMISREHYPETNPNVVRPRRCWMMPFVVDQEFSQVIDIKRQKEKGVFEKAASYSKMSKEKRDRNTGHTFLAVVQEERLERPPTEVQTEFRIYFLDSSPTFYDDVGPFLCEITEQIAENLRWTTHRNGEDRDPRVKFEGVWMPWEVAEQTNNTSCGYHAILNAWILALGLRPKESVVISKAIYLDLWRLVRIAMLGQLDWLSLTAFLLCKDLVYERSPLRVPEDRRFACTQYQLSEAELTTRLDVLRVQDDNLATQSEEDASYDYSMNVKFTEWDEAQKEKNRRERLESGAAAGEDEESEEEGFEEDGSEEEETEEEGSGEEASDSEQSGSDESGSEESEIEESESEESEGEGAGDEQDRDDGGQLERTAQESYGGNDWGAWDRIGRRVYFPRIRRAWDAHSLLKFLDSY